MNEIKSTSFKERALLVLARTRQVRWPIDILSGEFRQLVESTGVEVMDLVVAKLDIINPNLYIGKGKAEEVALMVEEDKPDLVVFDNELNFRQQRNLEDQFKVKVIDRTQLILDIFARHANTQEGILQVELAQNEYLMPRLRGKGIMLSKQGAGIGTSGPGEKKLEIDKRKILDRIAQLKKELADVKKHRDVMRKKRVKSNLKVGSFVGYTNAGKTTTFNKLTQAGEVVSSDMFTTLDTVSRTIKIKDSESVLFTDTVGFIYDLPPGLVESFKATLEELHYADVLIHLIDISNPKFELLIKVVDDILFDLDLADKPLLKVFNKIDLIDQEALIGFKKSYPASIFISAVSGDGIEKLKEKVYDILNPDRTEILLNVTFDKMGVKEYLHKFCEIIDTDYKDTMVVYRIKGSSESLKHFDNLCLKYTIC
ncbi:MAG: GTPase HflX [Candidatus Omnitrophica bacterium]|nr:GTPase HflX [Candidatus Omnitrophota bacterium]MDD5081354.1 GTPase HflX [Candidatus Omnitrophota bacterium]MDD5441570.1 GTPase HflX [Candidatus Omnitrophota bacterium]